MTIHQNLHNLREDHVIRIMVEEHDIILKYLNELNELNQHFQLCVESAQVDADLVQLERLATQLISAEPHHRREEDVLFPALEARGISGPPHVMRMEHDRLRAWKHQLKQLAHVNNRGDETLKSQIDETVQLLVAGLTQHICKENNILYPMALQAIEDEATWLALKEACDAVGYCSFTAVTGQ